MPIDASIYSQIRPTVQQEGPLDQYAKMISLKSMMGNEQLNEMQRTKLSRDMQEEEAFKKLFAGATPDQISAPDFLQRAVGASPTRGMALQDTLLKHKKSLAELDKLDVETRAAKAKDARDMLAGVTDQGSYDQWRAAAEQKGYPISHSAPAAFDPNWQRQQLMTADKFIETSEKAKDRELTTRGQDLTRTSATERNAVLKRGQDMTDQRQRELNGIMEGQTAEPTPELVNAIASGEIELKAPPTNARNPMMLDRYGKMLQKVKEKNPNYSQEMYPTIKRTEGNFAVGKQGDTVKAINTSIEHVGTLRELGTALKNGDVPAFNSIANAWAQQTGQPAPTSFDAAKNIIAAEIVKGISGAGGGVEDRNKAQKAFDKANSPEQLEAAFATVEKLLGGQLKGLEQQYMAGTYGRKNFREKYLTDASRKAFDTAKGGAPTAEPAAGAAAAKPGGIKFLSWE